MAIFYNGQKIAGKYKEQIIPDADTINKGVVKIATQSEVNDGTNNTSAITPLYLSNKQDVLTAGNNIDITNNVIKCDILPDNETIIQNNDKTFSVIGQKTKSNTIKFDWEGTLQEYNEAYNNGLIDPDWYCYITDDEKIIDFESEIIKVVLKMKQDNLI